jgi:thiol-disulfide isomerase/thioredoxin/tetratricopeptide (TPR) repeat protein
MRLLLILLLPIVARAALPDLSIRTSLDPASKVPRWLIEARPPASYHFNLKAPRSLGASGVVFKSLSEDLHRLVYASSAPELKVGASVKVEVYLCDDAGKTCTKKSEEVILKDQGPIEVQGSGRPNARRSGSSVRGADGFLDNRWEDALQAAIKTKRPLMIEFYGIWCPPCNRYQETVFPDPAFKKFAKKLVLLKMDADSESSFALKSHFKVGGYPTIVFASTPRSAGIGDLHEIGRITGFLPVPDLLSRANGILHSHPGSPKDGILAAIEKKETPGLGERLEAARAPTPLDPEWIWIDLEVRALAGGSFEWNSKDDERMKGILKNADALSSRMLLGLSDLIFGRDLPVSKTAIENSSAFLDALERRIAGLERSVPGVECGRADLESYRMERAELLEDQDGVSRHRALAIGEYRALLKAHPGVDSRGVNLELSALLLKDGKADEARAIYERMIRRFPKEFTFYHALARLNLEEKNYLKAREMAEKAVQFAYGDNLIRSMDRLIQVMDAQGSGMEARARGSAFLATIKIDPSLQVRTGRYLAQLEKTLNNLSKGKANP